MNKSAKGRRNEWKSIRFLKAQGYPVVIRSTGSFGEWDLVALGKDRQVMLVQVKSNRRPPLLKELPPDYDPSWLLAYHVWKDYAKLPDVFDAREGGTPKDMADMGKKLADIVNAQSPLYQYLKGKK